MTLGPRRSAVGADDHGQGCDDLRLDRRSVDTEVAARAVLEGEQGQPDVFGADVVVRQPQRLPDVSSRPRPVRRVGGCDVGVVRPAEVIGEQLGVGQLVQLVGVGRERGDGMGG
ncbi:hypothetical protein MXD60_19660 [Frankia sp. AgB32]|nr:hypothetical protein [Frankia sp. AgB32]MCK9896781.1 hypothetical protein [Frankia sp. AgB32]